MKFTQAAGAHLLALHRYECQRQVKKICFWPGSMILHSWICLNFYIFLL